MPQFLHALIQDTRAIGNQLELSVSQETFISSPCKGENSISTESSLLLSVTAKQTLPYVNTSSLCLSLMALTLLFMCSAIAVPFVLTHKFKFSSHHVKNGRLVLPFDVASLQAAEVRVTVKWRSPPPFACQFLHLPSPLWLWVKLLRSFVNGVSGVIKGFTVWLLHYSYSNLILESWWWPSLQVVKVR